MHSYKNVKNFVNLLDELNFNAIYLVSYAESKTIYQSKVLQQYSTHKQLDSTSLLTSFTKDYNKPLKSPTNEPVKDLIDLAHERGIKVFFWYEYGFMGDIKKMEENHAILSKNPQFLGLGNDRKPTNYHQKDYYFNAYHPEVQKYLLALVEEGIKLYPNIDGIQGDDRLPAMPKNSGYDEFTIAKYKKENGGKLPPNDFNDESWTNWRLNILNDFAGQLYRRVKAVNKNVWVSFAPNPYPWSKDNLMQDWPTWLNNKFCDLLVLQCYRYNSKAYKETVQQAKNIVKQSNPTQLFATGIILMEAGNIKMDSQLLKEQIAINRSLGINHEVFFYNDALNDPELKATFKEVYPTRALFPRN
ncbi:glycoside hydrolase family 10 protein [Pedobacter sp.]